MRKLVELTMVFLLGWALALYFLTDRENPLPNHNARTQPAKDPNLPSDRSLLPQSPVSGKPIVTTHTAEIDKAKQQ